MIERETQTRTFIPLPRFFGRPFRLPVVAANKHGGSIKRQTASSS